MARNTKVMLALVALVTALGVLGACAKGNTPAASGSSSTPPPPTTKTFTEKEWTLVTPAGWTSENWTSVADSKKSIRYKDASGNYFVVAIDPVGSDFSPDTIWRYRVAGTGFEIVSKEPCTATDGSCSNTDARFDGYVMWQSGANPPKVAGHVWYFIFGNEKKTTVDLSMFEKIIASVRATA